MKSFEPMLARSATLSQDEIDALPYPMVASPKLDGMRVVKIGGCAYTRNMKPVANRHVRAWIEANLPNGIDGELCLPKMTEPLEDVMSAFRSRDGAPSFKFAAFDFFGDSEDQIEGASFTDRLRKLGEVCGLLVERCPSLVILRQTLVRDPDALRDVIERHLGDGFEGTMVRKPSAPYKRGRSTLKEAGLLKIKPFDDEEATIIGFEEEMTNTNEDRVFAGRRSTAQAGLVPTGRLGAFRCIFADETEFTVAGFTDEQKTGFWTRQKELLGQIITVKHQIVHGGRKPGQAPRHPQFKGFRPEPV